MKKYEKIFYIMSAAITMLSIAMIVLIIKYVKDSSVKGAVIMTAIAIISWMLGTTLNTALYITQKVKYGN